MSIERGSSIKVVNSSVHTLTYGLVVIEVNKVSVTDGVLAVHYLGLGAPLPWSLHDVIQF